MRRPKRLSTAQLEYIEEGPCRPTIIGPGESTVLTENAVREIKARGYRIVYKRIVSRADSPRLVEDWAASTTVIGKRVRLGHGFRTRRAADQAVILWHELVHCEQQIKNGAWFYLRYLRASWRATFELEATVNEILAYQMVQGEELSEQRIRGRIEQMHPFYRLQRLDKTLFVKDATRAVMAALAPPSE